MHPIKKHFNYILIQKSPFQNSLTPLKKLLFLFQKIKIKDNNFLFLGFELQEDNLAEFTEKTFKVNCEFLSF